MNWNGKMKAVTFSYDDGVCYDKKLVEIFNRYGLKCTFNLNTGIQSPKSNWIENGTEIHRMAQDGLAELYKGHEIAVHGLTHASPTELTDEELHKEFAEDYANITRLYGAAPVGAAYAYGNYDDRTIAELSRLGIKYARTVGASYSFSLQTDLLRFKALCHHKDARLPELVEAFLRAEPTEPMLFYLWGHSYEFERDNNWDMIDSLCRELSGRDDVFYGTNAQVLL